MADTVAAIALGLGVLGFLLQLFIVALEAKFSQLKKLVEFKPKNVLTSN